MSRNSLVALTGALTTFMLSSSASAIAAERAPEFTHRNSNDWLNSKPLSLGSLHGKVVLVEFWTYDCINCRRSIPWVKATQARLAGKDFVIVAVHTPELPQEKRLSNVVDAVKRLGISYPVMIDLDYSYWNALNNQYWPAFYLIDRKGAVRDVAIGELHVGERRAMRFEKSIDEALAELSN
jgi:thiol-disulfide isomerase/thioredoxin